MSYRQLYRLKWFRILMFPISCTFPRGASGAEQESVWSKIEKLFAFISNKHECAICKLPFFFLIWVMLTGLVTITDTTIAVWCYFLIFFDMCVILYIYLPPIRYISSIMFTVFFAFVYLIIAILVFPFKKLWFSNSTLFTPRENERIIPLPAQGNESASEDLEGEMTERRNARLLVEIRQRRVNGSRINDILMEANNSGVDPEAIISLRRRMRRDRIIRRRLTQLEDESKFRIFLFFLIFWRLIRNIDQNDLIENVELNAIIRNMTLYNKLREYSTIYQKEFKYYEYLRKELEKDVDPFPENCAVCLSEFEDKDNIIKVNWDKMHVFHTSWLSEWMKMKQNWPLWREELATRDNPFVKPYKKSSSANITHF